jgi:hypothetical protein
LGEGVNLHWSAANLADGSMMLTYNKMPLYYWSKDTQPGDTTGQGNRDVWFVVSADGNSVGNDNISNDNTDNDNSNENIGNDNIGDDNGNDNTSNDNNGNDNGNDNGDG